MGLAAGVVVDKLPNWECKDEWAVSENPSSHTASRAVAAPWAVGNPLHRLRGT